MEFNGNGWTIIMDGVRMVFDRGVDRIDVVLPVELPAGKSAADLRILITQNMNQDTSAMTNILNDFFTA